MAGGLRDLGLLPLAERSVTIGDQRKRFLPAIILAVAIVLVALQVLTVAIAFFTAAVLIVAIGSLTMREAYASLEPEVLVLIGALTPLSHAVQENGGTALIGHALAGGLAGYPPLLVLGGIMLAAMVTAPFLHNAPTVLVLAPIGVTLAQQLHLSPDAFLMAVATGAGCDFLTPIGHQCNTLVRGPRRLSLRRLLAARPATVGNGHPPRPSADRAGVGPHRLNAERPPGKFKNHNVKEPNDI